MNIEKNIALSILERMLLIRHVEESIAAHYGKQKMRCPTHLSSGQEGVPASLSVLLDDDDYAVSTHRGHAHYLGKGGNVDQLIAELHGKATGCSRGIGGSMHLIDTSVGFMGTTAIVGNTIPIGVGLGLSIKTLAEKKISVVFLGDGSTEEGVFYESVNFAVLHKLPVLFVCENNFYSVYSPLSVRQPEGRSITQLVEGMGCPVAFGDGNDINSAYSILAQAVSHVRSGKGPYFVELTTYRHREHCGPFFDDDLEYRPTQERKHWFEKDPISMFTQQLIAQGWLDDATLERQRSRIQGLVDVAFERAEHAPYPEIPDLHALVYKNRIR